MMMVVVVMLMMMIIIILIAWSARQIFLTYENDAHFSSRSYFT